MRQLCRTQRKVAGLCSSNVSDTANKSRKTRKKKSSAVPPFRSGHMSAICARLTDKGKVGVQRGRETAGVPSFLPSAAGAATFPPSADGESPAEVQRKTSRPLGANTLTQFACPGQPVQEKKSRPVRANTLTQFAHPGQPVQEKEPPRQGELACGSSRAPVSRCRKKGRTQNLTAKPLQTLFIATR